MLRLGWILRHETKRWVVWVLTLIPLCAIARFLDLMQTLLLTSLECFEKEIVQKKCGPDLGNKLENLNEIQ